MVFLSFKDGKLLLRRTNRKCRMSVILDQISKKVVNVHYDHNHDTLPEYLTQHQKIISILERKSEDKPHENPTNKSEDS
jgi:hypothetical protein